jgi:hypothetical protein
MGSVIDDARDLVGIGRKAATAYERPDLDERLAAAQERLDNPHVRVLVVGEFKQGKSSLINAAVGSEVCPIDDDVATSVPTMVAWGAEPGAAVTYRAADGQEPRRADIALGEIATWASEHGNKGNERGLALVEVRLPSPLLERGLALVDTPGVGGLGSVHSALTMAALPLADAVLFLSDAAQELTEPEVAFLRSVVAICPVVLVLTTKIDLFVEWRKVHELDGLHLADAGLAVAHGAVSSLLRSIAVRRDDRVMNEESGFPSVLRWMLQQVGGGVEQRAALMAARDVHNVAEMIRAQFEAEAEVLSDPQRRSDVASQLEQARTEAEVARSAAAAWQQAFGDTFGDAAAEIDHDLRLRIRELTTAAEASVDEMDPGHSWQEFEPWLYREVSRSVGEHMALRHELLMGCVTKVAVAFDAEDDALGDEILVPSGDAAAVTSAVSAKVDLEGRKVGNQALTLLRNSYSGISMFGVLGHLAGLVVAPPVSVGLGLLLGGKSVWDERTRQLAQRRAQAKASARRYLDDVSFLLGKDQRDTLRSVERSIRDHFTRRAEERYRTASAAYEAVYTASTRDEEERGTRLGEVQAELERLRSLEDRAAAFAAAVTGGEQ